MTKQICSRTRAELNVSQTGSDRETPLISSKLLPWPFTHPSLLQTKESGWFPQKKTSEFYAMTPAVPRDSQHSTSHKCV